MDPSIEAFASIDRSIHPSIERHRAVSIVASFFEIHQSCPVIVETVHRRVATESPIDESRPTDRPPRRDRIGGAR